MRAAGGAIDAVTVKDGELEAHVIGESEAAGICGSGLVDAAASMLELGILDDSGYLEDGEITIKGSVILTQNDIRMLQLAKSAIYAGIVTLIQKEGLMTADVDRLFIAGGFGNYLNGESALAIGLLPKALTNVTKAVGNAALAGASILLLNQDAVCEAKKIAEEAKTIDLHGNASFSENYVSGMIFDELDDL